MGLDFDSPGVDADNITAFAKTSRIIGVAFVIVFLLWGNLYEWSYYKSPFEAFIKMLGSQQGHDWSIFLTITIGIAGWFYRFYVGVRVCSTFLKVLGFLKKLVRSI
ncbi:hypothetical protein A3Q34_00055 [Colwellia sp. PAMC 20917]|nr:hypothetical protein A3Q34_00055 [Colwellia sp. PAMC 20917]